LTLEFLVVEPVRTDGFLEEDVADGVFALRGELDA
jgi:hypothetical protein